MELEITYSVIPPENIGDEVVRVYGVEQALYDTSVTSVMRQHLTGDDKSRGFGMCDAYLVKQELLPDDEGNVKTLEAVLLVWSGEEKLRAVGPMNYFDKEVTVKTLSLAANMLSLAWNAERNERAARVLGGAYYLIRRFVGNGCELFTDQEIINAFGIID